MPELPKNQVLFGNCLEVMKTLPDNSLDAIVSDPPYGLGTKQPSREDIIKYLEGGALDTGGDFMGKDWEIPPVAVWAQCFRILKPGGHLLSFAGTRTFDMMSVGIRAAGFEDRDTVASMFGPSVLQWVYGAGFPKSLDIAKAIDKMARGAPQGGPDPQKSGKGPVPDRNAFAKGGATGKAVTGLTTEYEAHVPTTEDAKKWAGWGTALKPAWEPILCFRKPPGQSTTRSVLEHGAGALNITGCRTELSVHGMPDADPAVTVGRWPANVILSHTAECKRDGEKWDCAASCPVAKLDEQSGISKSSDDPTRFQGTRKFPHEQYVNSKAAEELTNDLSTAYGDEGGASRYFPTVEPESSFFYTAKASWADRNEGLDPGEKGTYQKGATHLVLREDLKDEELALVQAELFKGQPYDIMPDTEFTDRDVPGTLRKYFRQARKGERGNIHVTVKPVALMRWLVRLVCPKGGCVLDPYAGSGTTLVAAAEEGMDFIGIELDKSYHDIASKRASAIANKRDAKKTEDSIFAAAMGLED